MVAAVVVEMRRMTVVVLLLPTNDCTLHPVEELDGNGMYSSHRVVVDDLDDEMDGVDDETDGEEDRRQYLQHRYLGHWRNEGCGDEVVVGKRRRRIEHHLDRAVDRSGSVREDYCGCSS